MTAMPEGLVIASYEGPPVGTLGYLLGDPETYQRMSQAARSEWQGIRLYADDVCAAAAEVAGPQE